MAMRNKMDLSLGIALGSSLQIALFVAPLLVFASYLFGSPMNLEFTIPEVVAVLASVFIVQHHFRRREQLDRRRSAFVGLGYLGNFILLFARSSLSRRAGLGKRSERRVLPTL
jgi:calcium/proton exchanger cax